MKRTRLQIFLFIVLLISPHMAMGQWEQMNGANNRGALCFTTNGTNIFAGSDSGLFSSRDSGLHWVQILPKYPVLSMALSDKDFFLGTKGYGVFHSIDQGKSWVISNTGLTEFVINSLAIFENGVFAGTDYGLFVSSDNGSSWQVGDSSDARLSQNYVFSLYAYGDELFAGTYYGGVYLIKKDTSGWQYNYIGLHQYVTTIIAEGTSLFAGTYDGGLFLFATKSNNWMHFSPNYSTYSLAAKGLEVFAGTSRGVYFTTNSTDWSMVGLPEDTIKSLLIFGDYIFAGTNTHGIWRNSIPSLIASNYRIPSLFSGSYSLRQNFPNPFSTSTTIPFDLPDRTFISLKVYDITGREVAILANEMMDAGSYARTFNADALPSGMYVCHLEAGQYQESRAFLVLR